MQYLNVKLLHRDAKLPTKAYEGDLGYDLYAVDNAGISPGQRMLISTGIAIALPDGWGAFIKDRSGVSAKNGVYVHAGVIDHGYRGEIKVLLQNQYDRIFFVKSGDKIAQLVPIPVTNFSVYHVAELNEDTERGSGGFGSSGR